MKILFICTGNTCRSPIAEAIFNSKCNLKNVKAESAGLSVVKNSYISNYSSSLILDNLNCNYSSRVAVQLTEAMMEEADLILTMTKHIKKLLILSFNNMEDKIFSLNEYVGVEGDISDPYGGNKVIYKNSFDLLDNSIQLLINKIKEDKDIRE